MATNNFKPFATAANANVTAQADWESLPALLSGFTAGKASSAQVNKAIRQASFIAAALAQYTANKSGLDVLDDGDLNGFISKMGTAFGKDFQALDATLTALAGLTTGANKLPYFTGTDTASQTDLTSVGRDIIGKGTIADILTYLGLNRFVQIGDNPHLRLILNSSSWYVYDDNLKRNIPADLSMGGTGALDAPGARTNLGLGNSATKNTGTKSGTVAAGDDSRITGAMQKGSNGSDIPDKPQFLSNIGVKSAGTKEVGASAGQIPDMSFFTSGPGWFRLPSGHIIQYGTMNIGPASWQAAQNGWAQSVAVNWSYPIPFPNQASIVIPILFDGGTSAQWVQTTHANLSGKINASITGHALSSNIPTSTCSYYIFAIGN
ncbi:gp53-like domain-containing protein [Citrobacter freundii]|uniref:gp53-like domain-containing protein n=1 Tax=Citrobacter freundii TaxID=546 RepID=UPI0023B30570|nr:hypothetical protein [Citrobacter freundii]MDE9603750.1 hypothetical protein [Citrobacter freundii]